MEFPQRFQQKASKRDLRIVPKASIADHVDDAMHTQTYDVHKVLEYFIDIFPYPAS